MSCRNYFLPSLLRSKYGSELTRPSASSVVMQWCPRQLQSRSREKEAVGGRRLSASLGKSHKIPTTWNHVITILQSLLPSCTLCHSLDFHLYQSNQPPQNRWRRTIQNTSTNISVGVDKRTTSAIRQTAVKWGTGKTKETRAACGIWIWGKRDGKPQGGDWLDKCISEWEETSAVGWWRWDEQVGSERPAGMCVMNDWHSIIPRF